MYGTDFRLQEFVLYQLDPCRYSFDIDEHRGGFDNVHLQIYQDMKQWFWENAPVKTLSSSMKERHIIERSALKRVLIDKPTSFNISFYHRSQIQS
jgi:hypothetical protein